MDTVFMIFAGLGGTLIVCQFILSIFGVGADHHGLGDSDAGHDAGHPNTDVAHHDSWYVGLLTFRTVSTAITFAGLGGMCAEYYALPKVSVFITSVLSGIAALFAVAMIMRGMAKLKSDGTVNLDASLGQKGTVYLRIPGNGTGPGKVTLNLQNRTVELEAITKGPELATGSPILVREILDKGVVEVCLVEA